MGHDQGPHRLRRPRRSARVEIESAKKVADCVKCAKEGKTLSDELVVDPETKGVRWTMVWLIAEKGGPKIAIHPDLKKAPPTVTVDQPCCLFEPRALFIRTGQTLVAKNSADFVHNVRYEGSDKNPTFNRAVGSKQQITVDDWVEATESPSPMSCTIHGWMKANVMVLAHPYFAVTNPKGEFEIKNAPAGNYRIVMWNEKWVAEDGAKSGRLGIPVTIKPDAVTDLGDIRFKP